ncbi:amidohydrolase [Marinilactibacillus kalidii]|uniref:amidohydrolase n=1 Tax=Marinilactibacillus kalidii TaxID=2820274 RepID=UPI001ABDBB20|nr:amidohydrolase [Marinilactibacillus kalidii]
MKLYINGKIYVERNLFATTMLLEDSYIKAVGQDELKEKYSEKAQVIDLKGATVVPGMNDSHLHFLMTAEYLDMLEITDVTSMKELIERSRNYIKEKNLSENDFLYTEGWNQNYFTDIQKIPDRADLDKISTTIPIAMIRVDRHIMSLNSKAIKQLKLTKDSLSENGGEVLKDKNGEPTGVLTEGAIDLVRPYLPESSKEKKKVLLKKTMRLANSQGLTSMHTNDAKDETIEEVLDLYNELEQEEALTIRFYQQIWFNDDDYIQPFFDRGYTFGQGSLYNKLGPVKLFSDGTLGARTAAMREGYTDDPENFGVETKTQKQLNKEVQLAVDHQFQVIIHGIGDKGVERILDAYDAALNGKPNTLRLGVNHMQITGKDLIERVIDKGYLTYVQPIFLNDDIPIVLSRIGHERAATSYAFGTLAKAGVHQSFSSDAPIVSFNPWENIYSAVTRKRLNGEPETGFLPEEAVDVFTAVDAYTIESAYASFEEEIKGRLKPGFLADFVVIDKDIFTCPPEQIKDTQVLSTVVGGIEVYKKENKNEDTCY